MQLETEKAFIRDKIRGKKHTRYTSQNFLEFSFLKSK